MSISLVCYRCGEEYPRGAARCDCGEPLWFDVEADAIRAEIGAEWTPSGDASGLWRYAALLPVAESSGIGCGAGDTPLIRSERLDPVAGCRTFVKDETENPTGSFKDRGSAVAVQNAIDRECDTVGTVSYGNMAISTAAHAASAGRECVVLVPDDVQPVRLELIAQYDPIVLRVAGDYGALYDDALELNATLPVEFSLSDAPARVSGYKTCLFEIYEALFPETPDAIALPASSGGFASGIWRGLRDLRSAGLIERVPRLYLAQTAASDPISRAFRRGEDEVSGLPPADVGETIAHSIGNPDPPSGNRALAAVRRTDGEVLSVSDDEIRDAKQSFAERGGLCVEPASATPLAAVRKLSERGEIGPDDTVVLLPTGTGFKEMGTRSASTSAETIDRTAVRSRLETLLSE